MELRIKEICKKKGITQKHLASLIGITPVGLAKSLSGNTTLSTLERIATALNVPIQDLFAPSACGAALTCPHCGKEIQIHVGTNEKSTDK